MTSVVRTISSVTSTGSTAVIGNTTYSFVENTPPYENFITAGGAPAARSSIIFAGNPESYRATTFTQVSGGQLAEEATLTFGGQIKSFKISAGEATETLGTGFLNAYAIISGGQPLIKGLGDDLEVAAKQFSNIFVGIAAATKEKGLGIYADLAKVAVEGLVGESGTLQRLEKTGMKFLNTEKETSNQREDRVKTTKKILTFDEIIADIQKKILATEKLTTKEKTAQQALDKKKAEISALFDIDRINLQVALSRKLSGEDELRVKILQKLADGTKAAVDEAQRYVDVLKVIEDGVISTEEIDMLAKKWGISTTEVLLYIQQLFAANEELRKMLALLKEIANTKLSSTPTYAPFTGSISELSSTLNFQNKALQDEKVGKNSYVKLAEGGVVNSPTLAMIGEAGSEAVIPLDKMGGFGTTVNVNVAGSVISEGQLQSVIQDALYNLNRAGSVTQLTNLGR
jgi:transcriptional regulator with XRE-family HTH domain